jgi:hypothetical protein
MEINDDVYERNSITEISHYYRDQKPS